MTAPSTEPPRIRRRYRPWRTPSRLLRLLYLLRVPVIVAVALAVLGGLVGQLHEIVRVMVLDQFESGPAAWTSTVNLVMVYLLLYVLTWTLLAWSEYAIRHRFPPALARGVLVRGAVRTMPALVAALPWVGATAAAWSARQGLTGDAATVATGLTALAPVIGVAVIGHALYVRRTNPAFADPNAPGAGTAAVLSALFGVAMLALAIHDPAWMGRWFGTTGILLAAAVSVVPALTWLTASPWLPAWHWLSAIVAIVVTWSLLDLNDNHPVRPIPQAQPAPVVAPEFTQAFARWLAARPPADDGAPTPVVIVAAEGGGIRAAYFTAQVLAALHDRCPRFTRHLFAVSGVSGGSVGAAVYAGLVAARGEAGASPIVAPATSTSGGDAHAPAVRAEGTPAARDVSAGDGATPADACGPRPATPLADDADAVLRRDFLAPVTATLLYPDLLQRLWPAPIDAWDRAVTLERTLERAVSQVAGTDVLQRSLYGYWRAGHDVPLLLFNATHVASGARVVAAPVRFDREHFNRLTALVDHAPATDLRLSTAAVLSARFPLVTPAAYLMAGEVKHRYVDGGYFDNSGAATLAEALDAIDAQARRMRRPIAPIVIAIGNSPSRLAATSTAPAGAEPIEPSPRGLGELMSPVRTTLNARVARGSLATEALRTRVDALNAAGRCASFVEFRIGAGEVAVPLGWQLSLAARRELRAQLDASRRCDAQRGGIDNGCAVQDVVARLDAQRPGGCDAGRGPS